MYQDEKCLYQSTYAELHIEHLYTVEINATFSVFVKSYGFTGEYNFCMQKEQMMNTISNLKELYDSLFGSCRLIDADSDSHICIEFENKNLKISGQLGGSYEDNFMKFSFLADQTLIKLLMNTLSVALNN